MSHTLVITLRKPSLQSAADIVSSRNSLSRHHYNEYRISLTIQLAFRRACR